MSTARVFLLSPANCAGERMRLLLRRNAASETARRLRGPGGAPLGEVFQFASALYFRGKLAYARAFARPPRGTAGDWVIVPGGGLLPSGTPIQLADLRAMARVPVDPEDRRYRAPLVRDARVLEEAIGPRGEVVLLGSIASGKYTSILVEIFGDRLVFPPAFVGRGDLSRGGLLLRATRSGEELPYAPVAGAVVHGPRAAKLPRLRRSRRASPG